MHEGHPVSVVAPTLLWPGTVVILVRNNDRIFPTPHQEMVALDQSSQSPRLYRLASLQDLQPWPRNLGPHEGLGFKGLWFRVSI